MTERIVTAKVAGAPTSTTHQTVEMTFSSGRTFLASACGAEGRQNPRDLVVVEGEVNCPRCLGH
jgi:hypothetical protein